MCMDNIDCFGLGHKIPTRAKPLFVLPWNNNVIMKLECCLVPPLGMVKALYLLSLSLLYYTLFPLMTTENCVAYMHLVKLLTCTCEMVGSKTLCNRTQLLGDFSSGNYAD